MFVLIELNEIEVLQVVCFRKEEKARLYMRDCIADNLDEERYPTIEDRQSQASFEMETVSLSLQDGQNFVCGSYSVSYHKAKEIR